MVIQLHSRIDVLTDKHLYPQGQYVMIIFNALIKDLFLIARGPNISANLQEIDVIRIVFNKSTKPTQQTI